MDNQPLTERQTEVLKAIREHLAEHGRPPTLAELGERLGIRNPNGVRAHVLALERKGYIDREVGASRGIAIRGWTRLLDATLGRLRGRHKSGAGRVLGEVTYHLYWTTRRAKPLLGEPAAAAAVERCVRQVAAEHDWRVLGVEVRPCGVRLSLVTDPEHSPAVVVDHMQWYCALLRLGELRALGVGAIWGDGFAAADSEEALGEVIGELEKRESEQ